MKPDIHPDYMLTKIVCACGNTWETGSTVSEIHVEVCNQCHPFFTGQQRLVDTLGRVERLRRRYAAGSAETPEAARAGDHVTAPTAEAEPASDAGDEDTSDE